MDVRSRALPIALAIVLLAALPGTGVAQVMKEPNDSLDALAFSSDTLRVENASEPLEDAEPTLDTEVRNGWHGFRADHGGEWKARVDKRNGRIEIAEGSGIPWVPGRGNGLKRAEGKPDLSNLESLSRGFLARYAHLLGVDARSLVLNQGRSGSPADYLWFVDFDVTRDGIPVEGARVAFRVNHGNLIQFGAENLPPAHVPTPKAKLGRDEALAALSDFIGGFHSRSSAPPPTCPCRSPTCPPADSRTRRASMPSAAEP
jgi:hypothetical protein